MKEIECPLKLVEIEIPDYPGCDEYIAQVVNQLIYNTKKTIISEQARKDRELADYKAGIGNKPSWYVEEQDEEKKPEEAKKRGRKPKEQQGIPSIQEPDDE